MAFRVFDRVLDQTVTTGTGTITLLGVAPTSYATVAGSYTTGDTTILCIEDNLGNWEITKGTVTITTGVATFARTTVLASSNSNSLVNFLSTNNTVFSDFPAAQINNWLNLEALTGVIVGNGDGTFSAVQNEAKAQVAYCSTVPLPANNYANGTLGVGATLTGTANGPLVIDGVTTITASVGQRVIIAGEAAPANNGWYTITQIGVVLVSPYILTRATDSDQAAEIGSGYLTAVEAPAGLTAGSSNNQKVFISIAPTPFIVGTSSLTFAMVGGTYAAGTGLTLTGTTFAIDSTVATLTGSQALTNKTLNGLTVTTTTGTLTLASGKTLTLSNTLTFTGTDGSSVAFGVGGTVLYNVNTGVATNVNGIMTGNGSIVGVIGLSSVGGVIRSNGIVWTAARLDLSDLSGPFPSQVRLTLTTGVPVTSSDVTAATTVYADPYNGGNICLSNGSTFQAWSFAEISLALTTTQTGTLVALLSPVVSSLTSTLQLVRGMQVTGTGIPGGTTISSINSATSLTLSANVTSTGPQSLTFKLPASTPFDVFATPAGAGGSATIQFGPAWTSSTARSVALNQFNGVYTNAATIASGDSNQIVANAGVYLGTIRTTATAGQTEDSSQNRLVWNLYNPSPRPLTYSPSGDGSTYSTSAQRQFNADTANQVAIMVGLPGVSDLYMQSNVLCTSTVVSTGAIASSFGEDGLTRASTIVCAGCAVANQSFSQSALLKKTATLGYHYYPLLQFGAGSGTQTWNVLTFAVTGSIYA